jgi:chromate transporter
LALEPANESAWPVLLASLQLGCRSFGGPIAHIGYFERSYVRRRGWITAEQYAGIVALCQLLPGPTSSQVGFLVGLHRAGWRGAIAAWLGFTLPSVILMYAFYAFAPRVAGPAMTVVLQGLKWVTVIVVAQAVWRMAKTLCPDLKRAAIAATVAVALSIAPGASLQVALLALSAVAGYVFCRDVKLAELRPSPRIGARVVWLAMALGLALLIALRILALQMPHSLIALGDIFYRTGALVFGGGHVVLPLLHDTLVTEGWMSDSAFLSGYGAAQVMPGPLFSVAAYLGAASAPAGRALLGAGVAVLCLFLPGMLLALAGQSLWIHGARVPRAQAALAGVNAGAVGILAAALYNPVLTGAMAVLR